MTDPPLTVFDAFLGSGHLQRLGNAELRRGLASWRAQVDDQRGDELRARSFEDVELAPYLLSGRGSRWPKPRVRRHHFAWYRLTSSQSRAVLRSLDDLIRLVEIELGR